MVGAIVSSVDVWSEWVVVVCKNPPDTKVLGRRCDVWEEGRRAVFVFSGGEQECVGEGPKSIGDVTTLLLVASARDSNICSCPWSTCTVSSIWFRDGDPIVSIVGLGEEVTPICTIRGFSMFDDETTDFRFDIDRVSFCRVFLGFVDVDCC